MLKTLLRVRLAAFAAYFTGASRSQKKRSGAQKIGMLLLMLYCFAAFGMLFYTSFPRWQVFTQSFRSAGSILRCTP